MVGLGIALFIAPVATGELFWPWKVTALTGRAIGAWLVGIGTGAGQMGLRERLVAGRSRRPGFLGIWRIGAPDPGPLRYRC